MDISHFSGRKHAIAFNKWTNQSFCTKCFGSFPSNTVHANGKHDDFIVNGFNADRELMDDARRQGESHKDNKTYHRNNVTSIQAGQTKVEISRAVRTFAIANGATAYSPSKPICVSHLCTTTGWDSYAPIDCVVANAACGAKCRVCMVIGEVVDRRIVVIKPETYKGLNTPVAADGLYTGGLNKETDPVADAAEAYKALGIQDQGGDEETVQEDVGEEEEQQPEEEEEKWVIQEEWTTTETVPIGAGLF